MDRYMAPRSSAKTDTFDVTELVSLFRDALLALLPIMDRSRIEWRDGKTYDPWENIERTLYQSIIGSCVESIVPTSKTNRLASYGLQYPNYRGMAFLVASDDRNAVLFDLVAGQEPFSEAAFVKLDRNLEPVSDRILRPLATTKFLLALPSANGTLAFNERIDFRQ
jgi:hypothetical protein